MGWSSMGKGHRGTSCSKCSVASDQAVLEKSVPSNWLILTASPNSAQEGECCNAHLDKATIRCMMCMMGVCVCTYFSVYLSLYFKKMSTSQRFKSFWQLSCPILPYPASLQHAQQWPSSASHFAAGDLPLPRPYSPSPDGWTPGYSLQPCCTGPQAPAPSHRSPWRKSTRCWPSPVERSEGRSARSARSVRLGTCWRWSWTAIHWDRLTWRRPRSCWPVLVSWRSLSWRIWKGTA